MIIENKSLWRLHVLEKSKYLDYTQGYLPVLLQAIDNALDFHNFLGGFAPWIVIDFSKAESECEAADEDVERLLLRRFVRDDAEAM